MIMANTFIFDDDEQPDMGSPLPDQDGDDDQTPEEGEEGNNRVFIMLLIGIGAFVLVAILCVVGYFALSRGGLGANTGATSSAATQFAEQTLVAQATPTLQPTETPTETATTTPVVIFDETPLNPLEPTIDPATATSQAMQTQAVILPITATARAIANATGTRLAATTPGNRTATPQIPKTGFADEVGLPSLIVITIVLLGVIFLARRLRMAPER
jgi:hypothetical protein